MTKSYTGHRGYQGQWVTAQEEEQVAMQDKIASQEMQESCILEWETSNGQWIEVYVWSPDEITVKLNGRSHDWCEFKAIPTAQQATAQEMGIVALLGPVALTAERKAAVDAAIQKF